MKKTIHFLAGIPRSGNTLVSALLNQHPQIYSSPISSLSNNMWSIENGLMMESSVRNLENYWRSLDVVSKMPEVFYSNVEKPIIFDREKHWGTPPNLEIIKKYITKTPKIVFTVRSIEDALASYININMKNLLAEVNRYAPFTLEYREANDVIADHIMMPNGDFDKSLLSLSSAFLKENNGIFHIVEYDDLINNTQEVMNKIYDFIEVDRYTNDLNNIVKIESDNDTAVGLPENMHEVRKEISASRICADDILSRYAIDKYSRMNFWRNNSSIKIKGRDF